jgi:hypothetical protein
MVRVWCRGVLALMLGLGGASVAQADVYKCRTASGSISFSDQPCSKGETLESVKVDEKAASAEDNAKNPWTSAECVRIARPIWDMQPLEAGGTLTPEQTQSLRDARQALIFSCNARLSGSALAYRCRDKALEVTRAVAKAADPAFTESANQAQAEYDRMCGEDEVEKDIAQHLRQQAS